MSDTDLHTLTGAYAVNALPPDEQFDYENHLRDCGTCPQEVTELIATAARLGAAVAEPAPPTLRERVLEAIQTTRQLSPLEHPFSLDQARRARDRRRWFQQPVLVAASVLTAVSLGLGAIALDAERRADRAERIAAVVTDPRATTITSTGPGGATAKVVAVRGDAVFSARALSELDEDRDYQLWVMGEQGEGSARSVGVLGRGSDGVVEHFVPGLDPGEAVGVTVEPRGGSEKPSGKPLMVMKLSA